MPSHEWLGLRGSKHSQLVVAARRFKAGQGPAAGEDLCYCYSCNIRVLKIAVRSAARGEPAAVRHWLASYLTLAPDTIA